MSSGYGIGKVGGAFGNNLIAARNGAGFYDRAVVVAASDRGVDAVSA
ncbi:hypothetical protein NB311A_01894 [Nitrobacter sp. Nb-311A]|nr:hypothetical protein [Nitrobacter sp. Nb-311A]EAQ36217.1 hypothetical protein NB311A_01894 [Nitrobacter sp. Nb-311A]